MAGSTAPCRTGLTAAIWACRSASRRRSARAWPIPFQRPSCSRSFTAAQAVTRDWAEPTRRLWPRSLAASMLSACKHLTTPRRLGTRNPRMSKVLPLARPDGSRGPSSSSAPGRLTTSARAQRQGPRQATRTRAAGAPQGPPRFGGGIQSPRQAWRLPWNARRPVPEAPAQRETGAKKRVTWKSLALSRLAPTG